MASPATAAFLAAWRSSARRPVTLVKVELTSPSARTLYLATAEVATPDGQVWESGISEVDIHDKASFLTNAVVLSSANFSIVNRQLSYQSGTNRTIAEVFTDYKWKGATVTIYFWERNSPDVLQRFKGRVLDYQLTAKGAQVDLLQRRDFNKEMVGKRVTRDANPRAPEQGLGQIIPILYGSMPAAPARHPFPAAYGTVEHRLERIRGASRLTRAVLVDVGAGPTSKTRVLFAPHACKTFSDTTKGCAVWMDVDGNLAFIDVAGGDIFNNATDGCGFDIGSVSGGTDPFNIAHLAIVPVQIELAASENADNPRYVLDPWNENSFAKLDYNASKRKLTARLPSLGTPGDLVSVRAIALYYTPTGPATTNLVLRLRNTVVASQTDTTMALATGGLTYVESSAITAGWGGGSGMPGQPWAFGDCVLEVLFTSAPASNVQVELYKLGLSVRLRPNRALLGQTPPRFIPGPILRHPRDRGRGDPPGRIRGPGTTLPVIAQFAAVDSPVYANLEGHYDDDSGTITDVASALIQRAPDMATHALVTYGLEDLAKIERGTSTFGSFKDARAKLKTWRGTDMVHAVSLADADVDLIRFLEMLSQDSLCWFRISPFNDKWHCLVWEDGAPVDYDLVFGKDQIAEPGPELGRTPETMIATAVKVPYGFDHRSGSPSHETFAAPGRSSSGHLYRNLRDQQMEVISSGSGQNNKLDVNRNGLGDFTATLTAGTYTPATLRTEVQAALEAGDSTPRWVVCWGGLVVTGANDKFTFSTDVFAPEEFTVTLDPGTYTMDELAAHLQTKMNAASTGFTVTYSRTTRLFTISRSGGNFNYNPNGGTDAELWTAGILFGLANDNSGTVSTLAAVSPREEELFAIGVSMVESHAFNLEWETGPNGMNAGLKNCASLLGFDTLADMNYVANLTGSFSAHSPKRDRENLLTTARDQHGGKREVGVEGRTIYDSPTAREVRDRLIDLAAVDRPPVRFKTEWAPDLEVGRVIEFHESADDLVRFGVEGSNGSWAGDGKRWLVLEVHQQGGGASYLADVVGVQIG
jgi:hypothetical protein